MNNDILKTLGYISPRRYFDKMESNRVSPTGEQGPAAARESLTARDGSSPPEAWARSRVTALPRARNRTRSSLVDPASSHMLVSKIKPCMSQCMPN